MLRSVGAPILVAIIFALTVASCAQGEPAPARKPVEYVDVYKDITVTYEVLGSTGVRSPRVHFVTPTGNSNLQPPIPFKQEIAMRSVADRPYLMVVHVDDSGWVMCRISIDGKVVSENRASGQFSSAECRG